MSQVNPIPGMVPDWSDLALIARDNGLPYKVFLRQIVESALVRTKNGIESQAAKLKNNGSRCDCFNEKRAVRVLYAANVMIPIRIKVHCLSYHRNR